MSVRELVDIEEDGQVQQGNSGLDNDTLIHSLWLKNNETIKTIKMIEQFRMDLGEMSSDSAENEGSWHRDLAIKRQLLKQMLDVIRKG